METNPKLRIFIATLCHEGPKVHIPAVEKKADRLYLLREKEFGTVDAQNACREIEKEMDSNKIQLIPQICDIFDLFDVVKTLYKINNKEKNEAIFLNISSGNKVSSNAYILFSMLVNDPNINPFYFRYDYQKKEPKGKMMKPFPILSINLPDKLQCLTLALLLNKEPHAPTKTELVKDIEEIINNPDYMGEKLFDIEGSSESKNTDSKKIILFSRKILDKLSEQKYVEVGKNKGAKITLTEQGKIFAKLLKPLNA